VGYRDTVFHSESRSYDTSTSNKGVWMGKVKYFYSDAFYRLIMGYDMMSLVFID